MIKKILATLALIAASLMPVTLTTVTITASPAQAAVMTDVNHAADDSGYNADIHVVCTNGNHRWLGLGQGTFGGSSGTACGYGGVQKIVVGYNQAVRCFNALPPYQSLYYMQTSEVPSYASLKCYMQRPI